MLSYLSLISNPADDLRLYRIINNPPRQIGDKSIEALRELQPITTFLPSRRPEGRGSSPELARCAPSLMRFAR